MSVQELARLQARVAALRERHAAILAGQQENDAACEAAALKVALGDTAAQRGFEQMVSRGALLAAQATALSQAMAAADAAIAGAEASAADDRAAAERKAVLALLQQRLQAADEIEAMLRALLPKIVAYGDLGTRIERCAATQIGRTGFLPMLAQEAAAGRLAEFMAGLGFGAWLPLTRPETRPAIAALKETEEALQGPYLARVAGEPVPAVLS